MIETGRLLLRLPHEDDGPALAAAIGDPEVMRYIGRGEIASHAEAVTQIEAMRRAWTLDGFGCFMVVRKSDGATLGRVGLLAWDPALWRSGTRAEIGAAAEIELGWTLLRSAWGLGYATEAAVAAKDWALREVRPARLVSLIHPANGRSQRVAVKLGERCEGTLTTFHGVEVGLWVLAGDGH